MKEQVQDFQTQAIKATEKYKVAKVSLTQNMTHINALLHTLQQIKQSSAEKAVAYELLAVEHQKLIKESEEMKERYQTATTELAEIMQTNQELMKEKRAVKEEATTQAAAEAKKLQSRASFNRGYEGLLVSDPTQSSKTNISDVSRFLRELKARLETNLTPAKNSTAA